MRITLADDPQGDQGGAQPAGRAAPAISKIALIAFLIGALFLAAFLWIAAHEPTETSQQLASRNQPLYVAVGLERFLADLSWHPGSRPCRIDIPAARRNNRSMSRPEAVRRVKTYSAASGYVYQYYFYEVQKTRRGFSAGTEYVYMVSLDRRKVFPLRIFVKVAAVEKWGRTAGRALSGTEEYARWRNSASFKRSTSCRRSRPRGPTLSWTNQTSTRFSPSLISESGIW